MGMAERQADICWSFIGNRGFLPDYRPAPAHQWEKQVISATSETYCLSSSIYRSTNREVDSPGLVCPLPRSIHEPRVISGVPELRRQERLNHEV